ncbi:MAG: D-2-hydroxyacid dehydrogenase [Chloroflexi bacterium]|nr:D-2-hydroxyacid dehydrogenase [Chloroflexota bacterium]
MKIVVLDGGTLNPGDLTWEGLEALGDTVIYDRTPPELVIERSRGAEVVLVNKVVIDRETMEQLPELKFICVLATGYNVIDTAAAKEKGILVANIPTYGTQSVAQMMMAHVLNLAQHVGYHADTVRAGRWSSSDDWCYWDFPMVELHGLTMGVVGFGRIGRNSAAVAKSFGMKILAFDEFVQDPGDPEVEMVDFRTLLQRSDVVTFHTPLTPETEGMLNAETLKLMKKTAFVINTSRGPVIDSQALADALNNDELGGAGLDVLDVEPPPADHPLLTAKNCYVTPHISWATRSARARLMQTAVDNVAGYINRKPMNIVNK